MSLELNNTNSTANDTTKKLSNELTRLSVDIKVIMWIMYTFITILAIVGNGIVCYIVAAFKRMRTVTNLFIINLAVGDMLMAILCIPFSFISNLILSYWPFGHVMCPIVLYAQAVTVLTSAYTLIAISIDRYVAILYPLKPRMTKFHAKIVIMIVWMVALLTSLPTAVTARVVPHPNNPNSSGYYLCQEQWKIPLQRYHYSLVLMILQFFVPLGILVFTFSRIAIVVWGKKTPGEAEDNRDQKLAKSKRKMVSMMIVVVSVFTLCWLPFNVLIIVGDQYDSVWTYKHISYIYFITHWLAMSHTCYNPIIYCWMNAKFREGFRQLFTRGNCSNSFNLRRYNENLRRCGTVTTSYSFSLKNRAPVKSTINSKKWTDLEGDKVSLEHMPAASMNNCRNAVLEQDFDIDNESRL
ncbi:GPRNPY4 (predicted) [Pycnogonum litorale]